MTWLNQVGVCVALWPNSTPHCLDAHHRCLAHLPQWVSPSPKMAPWANYSAETLLWSYYPLLQMPYTSYLTTLRRRWRGTSWRSASYLWCCCTRTPRPRPVTPWTLDRPRLRNFASWPSSSSVGSPASPPAASDPSWTRYETSSRRRVHLITWGTSSTSLSLLNPVSRPVHTGCKLAVLPKRANKKE